MQTLELILLLLTAVVASSILEKVLPRLSLPLVQIAAGALIAFAIHTPLESGIDPELLLILFIAPLHFNESRHADSGALWANRWGIASLAVGLVFAIIASVGFTLHALLPAVPLAAALAFGAAMGSTDAVAVTELSKDFRFGKRHAALLTGEAFFNDVTGTVVFQCALGVAVSGVLSLFHAGEEFVFDLFGGLLGGGLLGLVAWGLLQLIRRWGIDTPTLHVTLELLLPFVIYLVAKQLHIGAVIAVVTAGLTMSLLPHRHSAQTAKQKLQSRGVWDVVSFVLNGVIFVILGMQLPRILRPVAEGGLGDALDILGVVALLTIVLEAVRFLWIVGMDAVHERLSGMRVRHLFTRENLRSTLAMALAGPKGGITLSLMLTVPATLSTADGFPVRDALVSIASGVILCTLLLANFAVPALVPYKAEARRVRQRVDAEMDLIEQVIRSIEEDAHFTGQVQGVGGEERFTVDDGKVDEPATAIVMKRYADQLKELAPHATKKRAEQAREVVQACEAIYGRVDEIAEELAGLAEDDREGESALPSLSAHFRALQAIYDAVESVQAQALTRELEFIKEMRAAGQLDAAHAKQLRNDVYIQQITL